MSDQARLAAAQPWYVRPARYEPAEERCPECGVQLVRASSPITCPALDADTRGVWWATTTLWHPPVDPSQPHPAAVVWAAPPPSPVRREPTEPGGAAE